MASTGRHSDSKYAFRRRRPGRRYRRCSKARTTRLPRMIAVAVEARYAVYLPSQTEVYGKGPVVGPVGSFVYLTSCTNYTTCTGATRSRSGLGRRWWRRRQRRRRRRRQLHERVLVAWHCGLVRAARGRGVRRVRSACCRGGRERRVAGGWGLPGGRRGKAQGGCRAGTHAVDIVVLHDRRRSAVRSPARHRPLHVRPKRLSRPRRGRGPAHQPRRRHGCRRLWRMRQRRQGRRQRAARPRRACPGC